MQWQKVTNLNPSQSLHSNIASYSILQLLFISLYIYLPTFYFLAYLLLECEVIINIVHYLKFLEFFTC